mgnify:CR=1 FL=1
MESVPGFTTRRQADMNPPTPGRAAARCHGPRAGTAAGRLLALALTLVGATTAFADASKVDGAFIRANARTASLRCRASVAGKPAAEAEIRFMMVDSEQS